MKHSLGLVSVSLAVLALGCGGGESGGNGSGSAGASAGAAAVSGGAAGAGTSSGGGNAGDTAASNGGVADSGGAANAGGDMSTGGGTAGGSLGAAGQPSSAGAGGAQAGAGGAPGLDPKLPPGANFDLTRFTLQLPVASGNSVQQVTDLSRYTSEYFSTAADGAMSFWCPVTGATTMNTHYPRTELRENPVGGDWAISGTHSLIASFKVTKSPKSKGLIIGQIHGNATDGTGEVLKLEWMSNNEIIASVEDNNSAAQSDKSMGTYALNDQMSYAIKLVNSQLTVSVTSAKGVTKAITSPYTASRWTKDSYYFKFGDYVQLNIGTSADGGRVSFYSFAIDHGNRAGSRSAAAHDDDARAATAIVSGVPVTVLVVVPADPDRVTTARRRRWSLGFHVAAGEPGERGKNEGLWQNSCNFPG